MKVGDRVRVAVTTTVYHHPGHRGQPFDVIGQEGEIIRLMNQWKGRPVSANFPYLVQFEGKFRGHFRSDELETVG